MVIILNNRSNYIIPPMIQIIVHNYSNTFRGITLWNLLSHDIISSPSIYIFKGNSETFLIKPTT